MDNPDQRHRSGGTNPNSGLFDMDIKSEIQCDFGPSLIRPNANFVYERTKSNSIFSGHTRVSKKKRQNANFAIYWSQIASQNYAL